MSDGWGSIYCNTWFGSPEPDQYDKLVTNRAIHYAPDCDGGGNVEPDERWFLNFNKINSGSYVAIFPLLPLAMSEKVTLDYLVYFDAAWDQSSNMDAYSDSGNFVYQRIRSGTPVPGLRSRWGGAGPTTAVTGMTKGVWINFNEVHNDPVGSATLTITDITNNTQLFSGNSTAYGTGGTLNDFSLGIGTDLASNYFYGYIANFKVFNAAGELASCYRMDDGSGTVINNECTGNDGVVLGTGSVWEYLPNPLAGQPL